MSIFRAIIAIAKIPFNIVGWSINTVFGLDDRIAVDGKIGKIPLRLILKTRDNKSGNKPSSNPENKASNHESEPSNPENKASNEVKEVSLEPSLKIVSIEANPAPIPVPAKNDEKDLVKEGEENAKDQKEKKFEFQNVTLRKTFRQEKPAIDSNQNVPIKRAQIRAPIKKAADKKEALKAPETPKVSVKPSQTCLGQPQKTAPAARDASAKTPVRVMKQLPLSESPGRQKGQSQKNATEGQQSETKENIELKRFNNVPLSNSLTSVIFQGADDLRAVVGDDDEEEVTSNDKENNDFGPATPLKPTSRAAQLKSTYRWAISSSQSPIKHQVGARSPNFHKGLLKAVEEFTTKLRNPDELEEFNDNLSTQASQKHSVTTLVDILGNKIKPVNSEATDTEDEEENDFSDIEDNLSDGDNAVTFKTKKKPVDPEDLKR